MEDASSSPAPRQQTLMDLDDDDMIKEATEGVVEAGVAVAAGGGGGVITMEQDDGDEEVKVTPEDDPTRTPQLRNYQQVALLRARDRNCVMVGTTGVGKSDTKRERREEEVIHCGMMEGVGVI